MTATPYLEPSVVPFVGSQFPLPYRERSPLFVAFVKAYYAWMEDQTGEGAATFYARSFLDLRDVDRTTQEFLVHVKQKFLNGLQLDTVSDTRQLIKHAKDLYRAKGSLRALDLFFRLLYDEVATVYYPKDDILVASSGNWYKPTYLELSVSTGNAVLEGKQVTGLTSGATAFVDAVVRRVIKGRLSDTAYFSALSGNFVTGEVVTPVDGSIPVDLSPSVVGSLTTITLDASGSGAGYSVGDVLPINSVGGSGGLARVSETVTQTGLIDLELLSGGYGYTAAGSNLHVSDTVVVLSNVVVTNAYARNWFRPYDRVGQSQATYAYHNLTGSPFVANQAVLTASGNAVIMSVNVVNSTAGSLLLGSITGTMNVDPIHTAGNSSVANLSVSTGGYVDVSANGWVVGTSNLVLRIVPGTGTFVAGETVVQSNPSIPTDASVQGQGRVTVSSPAFVSLTGGHGVFRPGVVTGLSSGATATVASVDLTLGLTTLSGGFVALPGNALVAPSVSGTVTFRGSGVTASFGVSPELLYTETVSVCQDTLTANLRAAPLAGPYPFSANPSANHSTPFPSMMTFANVVVGALSNVYTIVSGTQFDSAPIVAVSEPRDETMNQFDLTVSIANASSSFSVGEVVVQASTGGRGLVKSQGVSTLSLGNLRMNQANGFVASTPGNSNTLITGLNSGTTASVVAAYADRDDPPVGRNALVVANTVSSAGAVAVAVVVDSGFGYTDGESVWLGTGDHPLGTSATGLAGLKTSGSGKGSYLDQNGFLSSSKKLFDGTYYQNFSYEITSSRQLEEYVDALKRVVHVAGMRVFGRLLHVGSGSNAVSSGTTTIRLA